MRPSLWQLVHANEVALFDCSLLRTRAMQRELVRLDSAPDRCPQAVLAGATGATVYQTSTMGPVMTQPQIGDVIRLAVPVGVDRDGVLQYPHVRLDTDAAVVRAAELIADGRWVLVGKSVEQCDAKNC